MQSNKILIKQNYKQQLVYILYLYRYCMGSAMSSEKAVWPPADNKYPLATFAGGCFWGVELAYQREKGVIGTCVGYTAGSKENPSYEQVCTGTSGHTEAVQMRYDPDTVSYQRLCEVLYSRIDHKALNRQGGDRGTQYRSGIYYHTPEQKEVAEKVNKNYEGSVVEIKPIDKFWPAEVYHQQYLEKGGRMGRGQSAAKGCSDPIRCYG
eukprot:TRINITY_DN2677_c2_g1_i1.p2 TRINITY_DN2677_c2_g1~~TRINITY_DN2677_c2_g1_i1.p2  ORF type:complete len:208 (-),score=32.61 TRINITY_DN2677_c2_g1_i1:229-852(-)